MRRHRRSTLNPHWSMTNLNSLIIGTTSFLMIAIALTRTEAYLHLQTIVVVDNDRLGLFDVLNTYEGSYVLQWENGRTYRLTSY